VAALVDDVREFFLLREAEKRASAIAPETRETVSRELERARQKRDAAEALWTHGRPAEALVLARAALELAITASEKAGTTVDEAVKQLHASAAELPELDRDVKSAQGELYRKMVDGSTALDAAITPAVLSARERTTIKVSRISITAAIVFACLAVLVVWVRRPGAVKATASSVWGAKFVAANAVDGIDGTEWLLPDAQPGYLDIELVPPRSVKKLKMLNGTNAKDPERAINEYELQFFAAGQDTQPVKTLTGSFGATFNPTPPWTTVDVGVGDKIARVRLNVKSWTGRGASLAEIVIP